MVLLRLLLPCAERDEVLADLAAEHAEYAEYAEHAEHAEHAEYAEHAARGGRAEARRWLWRQAPGSAPPLLRWGWWRGWSGFEPRANAFRPGGSMLRNLFADARYAARRLRARPVYTLVSILTLALGIGGTAALFGIARSLMFEPLPYSHADEVGSFWMPGWWTEEEFLYLRGNFPGFRAVAAYRPGDATLRQGEAPARLMPGITTSSELFDVLGARPFIGRGSRAGDDAQGAEPVAVISYAPWQELGGQTSMVGTLLMLDGAPQTVIGVMPRGFWFPDPSIRLWHTRPLDPEGRNGSYTFPGRVAPGADVHDMGPQIQRLTEMIGDRFQYEVGADKTQNAVLTPLREAQVGVWNVGS